MVRPLLVVLTFLFASFLDQNGHTRYGNAEHYARLLKRLNNKLISVRNPIRRAGVSAILWNPLQAVIKHAKEKM